MTDSVKQIISFLRSAEYSYHSVYYNDYMHNPRPTYNFLIMHSGGANITTDKGSLVVKENDVLWIPKNSVYSVVWQGSPVVFSVLHFDFAPSFDPFLFNQSSLQIIFNGEVDSLKSDFQYLLNNDVFSDNFRGLSVFFKIFSFLYPLIQTNPIETQLVIKPALQYIEANYKERLRVKDLADLCFMSAPHFQHLFKKTMGISPITYKNIILISHVQRTLISNKNLSLQEIADEYNFDSTVYLCRLFKSVTGMTPTEIRKKDSLV